MVVSFWMLNFLLCCFIMGWFFSSGFMVQVFVVTLWKGPGFGVVGLIGSGDFRSSVA